MAEERAAALAPVQPDLLDLPTALEERGDHLIRCIAWEAANPDSAAVVGLRRLRHATILAHAVRCEWLVLCKVHPDGHALHRGARQVRCLIHGLGLTKFDVAKLAIPQLVHLQADHLHLATRLKEVNEVLLCGINGDVTHPERVPVWRLHALWAVATAAGGLRFHPRVRLDLVHVGVVDLYALSHELLAVLLHSLVHAASLIELHVRKVATNVPIREAHLSDCTTILEKLDDGLLLGLPVRPPDPDCLAAIRLRPTEHLWPRPRKARRPR